MTGFAQATTNGSGMQLLAGLDIYNMKADNEDGARVDPWAQISKAKVESSYEIDDFFKENSKGNLINRQLSSYNLLIRHIMREVSPELNEVVTIKQNGSAKQIKLGNDIFLVFQGKIYRRKG